MVLLFGRRPANLTARHKRLLRIALAIVCIWAVIDLVTISWKTKPVPPVVQNTERVFISALAWNSEWVLREYWMENLLAVCKALGPLRVFVSIYENGSYFDNTKGALQELAAELKKHGVDSHIVTNETHHEEVAEDMITVPSGEKYPRRIPYLAKLRNKTLQPLKELIQSGRAFDKILFLNDVTFHSDDVIRLLNTLGGAYAAACSMDYLYPPTYYDTFALRDADGRETIGSSWPYFGSWNSRNSMKEMKPARVKSCWNGIVSMSAYPFYLDKTPLQFRALPQSLAEKHVEASECCLIHADNPLTPTHGIWVNPHVRVGYTPQAYKSVNPARGWPSYFQIWLGLWKSRMVRWFPKTDLFSSRKQVMRRIEEWKAENPGVEEPGDYCAVDEMQVLHEDGWRHM